MKIYFSTGTFGKSSGGLKGNLYHLTNYIHSELANLNFNSNFEEFWFTLLYPPMFRASSDFGNETKFAGYYSKLPYCRINRKFKSINLTLKAPELSEYFEKEIIKESGNLIEIEEKFKNLDETQIAIAVIDKYFDAVSLIKSKLKSGDIFDAEIFINFLTDLKSKINPIFLEHLNSKQSEREHKQIIEKSLEKRKQRRLTDKPKDKAIRDIRVFYNSLPNKSLYPFDFQFIEIFLNLLSKKQFKCPTYHHLYIAVGQTFEEALKTAYAYEDWFIYGIATIEYDKYQGSNEKQKEEMVFEIISEGLLDIAKIDKLDIKSLEEVITEIKVKGIGTELIFQTIENNSHELIISYFSGTYENECPIFINIKDKATGKSKRLQIGKAQNYQIYDWLHNVKLTMGMILIKSGDSDRADMNLKNKPRTMEFKIAELLQS